MQTSVLWILPFVLIVIGLGTMIYVFLKQLKGMKEIHMESGKYPEKYFMMLGLLIGIPLTIILNILFQPKWISQESSYSLLGSLMIVAPMMIVSYFFVLINRRKIRPEFNSKRLNNIVTIFILAAIVLYIVIKLIQHNSV